MPLSGFGTLINGLGAAVNYVHVFYLLSGKPRPFFLNCPLLYTHAALLSTIIFRNLFRLDLPLIYDTRLIYAKETQEAGRRGAFFADVTSVGFCKNRKICIPKIIPVARRHYQRRRQVSFTGLLFDLQRIRQN